MGKTVWAFLAAAGFVALYLPQSAFADEALFKSNKCNKCHSVSAYGIEVQKDAESEEEAGSKVPDLSNVGNFHNAAFFVAFLNKEVEHTAHAGNEDTKKHKMKFKGSDDDLKKLADWLATLKKEPTKK